MPEWIGHFAQGAAAASRGSIGVSATDAAARCVPRARYDTKLFRKDDSVSADQSGLFRNIATHNLCGEQQRRLVVAAVRRITEAEAALAKARGRVEMARALAALPADAGDEDIVDLSEPYDAALHDAPPPAAAMPAAVHPSSRRDAELSQDGQQQTGQEALACQLACVSMKCRRDVPQRALPDGQSPGSVMSAGARSRMRAQRPSRASRQRRSQPSRTTTRRCSPASRSSSVPRKPRRPQQSAAAAVVALQNLACR